MTSKFIEKVPQNQEKRQSPAESIIDGKLRGFGLVTLEIPIPRTWMDFICAYLEWVNPEEGKDACYSQLMQDMVEATIEMLLNEVWGQNHTKAAEFVAQFGLQEITPSRCHPCNQDGFEHHRCGSILEDHKVQEDGEKLPSQEESTNPDEVLDKYPETIKKIVQITECALILELDCPILESPDRERVKITPVEYLQLWENYVEKR